MKMQTRKVTEELAVEVMAVRRRGESSPKRMHKRVKPTPAAAVAPEDKQTAELMLVQAVQAS